jgi:SAM-dependent methyltransferase
MLTKHTATPAFQQPVRALFQSDKISPRLFRDLSIYQDVVLAGRTALRGQRDCPTRWRLMEPYLPPVGAILDVGSNFGWFALAIAETRPRCVVASAEADTRSIQVQRHVLDSHYHRDRSARSGNVSVAERICLVTRRLNASRLRHWSQSRQRFDAALCLNVLHWMPDHRDFLLGLGALAARIFVEHPDPNEHGAGIERARREIGPIGPYLAELFPRRAVVCLGTIPSHRATAEACPRTLWLVEPPKHSPPRPASGLQVESLLKLAPCWPPRHWWLDQLCRAESDEPPHEMADETTCSALVFSSAGLAITPHAAASRSSLSELARRLKKLPERRPFTFWDGAFRRFRRFLA